jgi:hypothetical protein
VAELEAPGTLQGCWGRRVGRLAHEGAAIQVDAVEERVINGFFTSAQHPNKRRGLVCFTIDSEGQRVEISSAVMFSETSRMTIEKVGFLGTDFGPGLLRLMGVMIVAGQFVPI